MRRILNYAKFWKISILLFPILFSCSSENVHSKFKNLDSFSVDFKCTGDCRVGIETSTVNVNTAILKNTDGSTCGEFGNIYGTKNFKVYQCKAGEINLSGIAIANKIPEYVYWDFSTFVGSNPKPDSASLVCSLNKPYKKIYLVAHEGTYSTNRPAKANGSDCPAFGDLKANTAPASVCKYSVVMIPKVTNLSDGSYKWAYSGSCYNQL